MNWDAIGAIGEIAGSIAVVVTLVVLIRQVRAGTMATRAATLESVADRLQERIFQTKDEDYAGLIVRGQKASSLGEFNEIESYQLRMWWESWFNHFQVGFVQQRFGAVTTKDMQWLQGFLVGRLQTVPIARECWELSKETGGLRPDFVKYIEQGMEVSGTR